MVTLTTSIIFLLFPCVHFQVWGILGKMGGPRVRRPPMNRSATAESLGNLPVLCWRVWQELDSVAVKLFVFDLLHK
jgi:hypothetical protein